MTNWKKKNRFGLFIYHLPFFLSFLFFFLFLSFATTFYLFNLHKLVQGLSLRPPLYRHFPCLSGCSGNHNDSRSWSQSGNDDDTQDLLLVMMMLHNGMAPAQAHFFSIVFFLLLNLQGASFDISLRCAIFFPSLLSHSCTCLINVTGNDNVTHIIQSHWKWWCCTSLGLKLYLVCLLSLFSLTLLFLSSNSSSSPSFNRFKHQRCPSQTSL
jgi:hypothetical protein